MIYHWSTHADSEKRDLVDTVIDDYLKTQDEDIEKLLAITKINNYATSTKNIYSWYRKYFYWVI